MARGHLDDAVTGAIGDAAGAVLHPREGVRRLGARMSAPALVLVVAALAIGYLLGRRRRR